MLATQLRHNFLSLGLLAALALSAGVAQAAKFKVLHSFCKPGMHHVCGDGSNPQGAPVMDSAGNLYGTTATSGLGSGTVFELERKASGSFDFKTLYRFGGGGQPFGALIVDVNGNLYGTTSQGGNENSGVVFELSPNVGKKLWTEKVLYAFCEEQSCADGSVPPAGVTYAGSTSGTPYDGVSPLYGVTAEGGANNSGAIFQLVSDGTQYKETVLYSFCSTGGAKCLDGAAPAAGLSIDAMGRIFGTTIHGGGNDVPKSQRGTGVVFELSPTAGDWTLNVLYRFCSLASCADGALPVGELTIDATGSIVGTTIAGGNPCKFNKLYGCGTVFRLNPTRAGFEETVVYSFCAQDQCADGWHPTGSLLTIGASIFGATEFGGGYDNDQFGWGGGTVYELTGSKLNIQRRFCKSGCEDGAYPEGGLLPNGNGAVYGSALKGGANSGGAIFRLAI